LDTVEKTVNEFSFTKGKVSQKISPQLISFVKEFHGVYYSSQTKQPLFTGVSEGWKTLTNKENVRKLNIFCKENNLT